MKVYLYIWLLFLGSFLYSQTQEQRTEILKRSNATVLKNTLQNFETLEKEQKHKVDSFLRNNRQFRKRISSQYSRSSLVRIDRFGNPLVYTTGNSGAAQTIDTDRLYNGGGLNLNLEGQNMSIGIWDGGAPRATHQSLSGRVVIRDGGSVAFHPTHVAGTLIANENAYGGSARGMAFKANLDAWDWDNDLSEMVDAAYNGLLISNHSYGYDGSFLPDYYFGLYDYWARDVDMIQYYAPYYLAVFSAGNDRGDLNLVKNGFDLVNGAATAKNTLTVGAVYELQSYTAPSDVVMSSFSSWGPTDDGRIKPEVVAKGVNTLSAHNFNDSSYAYANGTSMAAPSVSGSLLLLQQLQMEQSGFFMRAATLKGLAMHTAREAGASPGPDYSYGWGLLDVASAAELILENQTLDNRIIETSLNNGYGFALLIRPSDTEALKVSISWTDPELTEAQLTFSLDDATPDLVNDLDIRLKKGGVTYYPWKLSPSQPSMAASQGDNTVDNYERIDIPNADPAEWYALEVKHKGTLRYLKQDYTIIISGAEEVRKPGVWVNPKKS